MMEVEYKAAAPDLEAIAARLEGLGATAMGDETESDTYYAHPMRDFGTTDEALRIRTRNGRRVLTYKGPRQEGPTRSRRELEVTVDGPLGDVLQALSFTVAGHVEKRRRSYRLEGLTVTLDHVTGLGDYVEVEALADDDDVTRARDAVLGLVERLGLGAEERRSYLELVREQGTGSSGSAASPPT